MDLWKKLLNYGDISLNIPRKAQTVIFQYIRYPSKFINLIESIKVGKSLSTDDLKSIGVNCPVKYQYLLK